MSPRHDRSLTAGVTRAAQPTGTVESDAAAAARTKGRPTPSRKEAEARNKARNKVPRTRKEQAEARRLARGESSSKMREAMKTGDERYLPARDRGPVRRFVRDYVDSRFSFIELLLPVMVVVLILGWSGSAALASFANATLLAVLLVIVVEVIRMRFRLRKELERDVVVLDPRLERVPAIGHGGRVR